MANSSHIWTGNANNYDRARPTPPLALLDMLTQLIQTPQPELVVDLGSGTGLSTAIWGERAKHVIGIEPNADMRTEATNKLAHYPFAAHIEYQDKLAQQTDLPDGCADIITAAQAFHWMEPTATLAEVARILRPGGLFAVYDYDWPPTIHWEIDQLALETSTRLVKLIQQSGRASTLNIWPKHKHLENMRTSGHFRFTREVLLHHVEQGDATRFLSMTQSNGFSQQFRFTEQETGIDRLISAAQKIIGDKPIPWYISYRIFIGVK